MKEQILTYLNMKDILDRYGIKHRGSQFCCPFHGTDKHPSAKAYEKSFYCFNCGKTGDLIQFVQYYFNLDFKQAMQKINLDFNLNLDSNIKVDYKKIKEIERKRKQKEKILKLLEKEFVELSKTKFKLKKEIATINHYLTILDWEINTYNISLIQDKIGQIDMELDELIKKMDSIKNS